MVAAIVPQGTDFVYRCEKTENLIRNLREHEKYMPCMDEDSWLVVFDLPDNKSDGRENN